MEQYTVLFVDDEVSILNALRRLFRGDPIKVLTAASAEDALKVMHQETVHLLVTDNKMPGMNGVELTRLVKHNWPDTFRILLSGQSDMEAVLQAINEGEAYRFILKPWSDIDLKVTVNIALAHYKLLRDNRSLIQELEAKSALLDELRTKHPEIFAAIGAGNRSEVRSVKGSSDDVISIREDGSTCHKR